MTHPTHAVDYDNHNVCGRGATQGHQISSRRREFKASICEGSLKSEAYSEEIHELAGCKEAVERAPSCLSLHKPRFCRMISTPAYAMNIYAAFKGSVASIEKIREHHQALHSSSFEFRRAAGQLRPSGCSQNVCVYYKEMYSIVLAVASLSIFGCPCDTPEPINKGTLLSSLTK